MNKLKILGLALLFVLSANVNAQIVKPKMNLPEMDLSTQLLGILNATDGLELNSDQKTSFPKTIPVL